MSETTIILTIVGSIFLIGLVSMIMDFIVKEEEIVIVSRPVKSNIKQTIQEDVLIDEALFDD